MSDTKRITLNVDANLHKKIKLIASVKGVSINDYLNQIIKDELDETDVLGLINENI